MVKIKHFAAALVLTACAGNVAANYANAASTANTAAKSASAAPTKDALVALEKSAYQAWKSRDAKFWGTYLSDRFVGYGSSGKLDKSSAKKEYAGADCAITSYALSDEQMKPIGTDAELLTYKATIAGTCDGQNLPANTRDASVYVRDNDQWKLVFHAEAAIFDAKAAPAKSAVEKEARKKGEAKADATDANTEAMLAVERPLWEAWREHDAKKIDAGMARDASFINIYGTYFATKADALKDWSGAGCDIKRVGVTNAAATMLSPAAGFLTFTGTAVGSCYGQKIDASTAISGASFYIKEGGTWKWTFGINVPSRP